MPRTPTNPLLRHVRRLAADGFPDLPTDRDLLRRFAAAGDQDAFAELVRRHGPMVLGVGERVLHSRHDAEDVRQAAFLVLARKAGSPGWDDSVGPWLYQVAYRLARKARADAVRRSMKLARLRDRPTATPPDEPTWRELHAVLDEELQRLPAKYREALVLCCLEGAARDEAAQRLGCPLGTLKSRLGRWRELLRARLGRRGVTLSAALLVVELSRRGARATPADVAAAVAARASALAQGAVRGWALKVAAMLALGVFAAGGLLAHQALTPKPPEQPPGDTAPAARAAEAGAQPGRDLSGDPLPAEALARLGTLRLRHGGLIRALAFNPDGSHLIAHGLDGVRVWDTKTGAEVRHFLDESGGSWAASVSPDGKLIALVTSGAGGKLAVWEVAAGRVLRRFGEREVQGVLFSPDGKVLAAAGRDGSIDLWDPSTGGLLRTLKGHRDQVWSAAFSADGKTLVSGSDDGTLRFWDTATGTQGREIGCAGGASKLVLSPDGTTLAAIGHDKKELPEGVTAWTAKDRIVLWDARTGKELRRLAMTAVEFTRGLRVGFTELAFTPDGKALVTGGMDGVVRVWDAATGKELRQFAGFAGGTNAFAFAPDGKALALTEGGFSVRLIDLTSGKDLLPTPGHRAGVSLVGLTPGGRQVVTAGWDRTLRFWDPATGKELRRRALPGVRSVAPQLLPGSKTYLWPGADKMPRIWDLETGEELRALRGNGVLSPDGKTLAALADDGKAIRLLDPATGKTLLTLPESADNLRGLYFTPDGRRLFGCRGDRGVGRWDVATGEKLPSFSVPSDGSAAGGGQMPSYTAQFSPDGKFLAFGLQEGFLPVLDAATGREVRRFPTAADGACVFAFSPDGKTLAWAGWTSPTVHLGEIATGKERHHFTGHRGRIISLAFSPDGKTLLSGAEDTTALVWDLRGRIAAREKPPAALTPAELDARWADLAGMDAAAGYRALRSLAADPSRSIPFLGQRLKPVPSPDEKELARWIADLDSEAFAVRQRATAELEKWGESALPAVRKALDGRPALETRRRLEELLKRQEAEEASPSAERLRALEALEQAATPEARRVLDALAKGAPGTRQTEDARAALRRLEGRR